MIFIAYCLSTVTWISAGLMATKFTLKKRPHIFFIMFATALLSGAISLIIYAVYGDF